MIAGVYNITCQQGSTFDLQMTLQYPNPDYPANCVDPNICPEYINWDLTGYTARMHVRRYVDSAVPVIVLTTENDRIRLGNLDPSDGTINLFIRAEDTRDIPSTNTSCVYDLEIISPSNEVDRIIQGAFNLSLEVTR
jgi:hypothetical protein